MKNTFISGFSILSAILVHTSALAGNDGKDNKADTKVGKFSLYYDSLSRISKQAEMRSAQVRYGAGITAAAVGSAVAAPTVAAAAVGGFVGDLATGTGALVLPINDQTYLAIKNTGYVAGALVGGVPVAAKTYGFIRDFSVAFDCPSRATLRKTGLAGAVITAAPYVFNVLGKYFETKSDQPKT